MLKLDSKKGTAKGSQTIVFNYLTDFRNFAGMLPSDQLQDLTVTNDSIRFTITGLGTVGLKIKEKYPDSQIVITATEDSSANFSLRFMIGAITEEQCDISLSLEASLNMLLEIMARTPLQTFIDMIIDKISTVEFRE